MYFELQLVYDICFCRQCTINSCEAPEIPDKNYLKKKFWTPPEILLQYIYWDLLHAHGFGSSLPKPNILDMYL